MVACEHSAIACSARLASAANLIHESSGVVYKGKWNKTEVALKVLKTEGGTIPRSNVRQHFPAQQLTLTSDLLRLFDARSTQVIIASCLFAEP
jgi:hypothetical protein